MLKRELVQRTEITPTELVTRCLTNTGMDHELILLTGESGSGKTSWCLELIHASRAEGIEPLGFISPAVFENGIKTGIDLVNITSGERRRLAVKGPNNLSDSTMLVGIAKRNWIFDEEVLAWGNRLLAGLDMPGALLILDELGPLEFLDNNGLSEGMKLLGNRDYRLACVVVRPSLLRVARTHWQWAKTLNICKAKVSRAEWV